jgi:OmpA-OmpF porin, OOP family
MKSLKIMTALSVAGLLTACVSYDLDMVASQPPTGRTFDDALHNEYLLLALAEDHEDDWEDAKFFAMRATDAAAGMEFGPQEIKDRNIPEANRKELGFARSSVINAIATGKMGPNAAHIARAQAKFDCWLQEQEENTQPEDIAKCRSEFEEAMAAMMVKEMPAPAPAPAPAPEPVKMMEPRTFVVHFDHDSAEIDQIAAIAISHALKVAKDTSPKLVQVGGHADTSGDVVYNNALSQRRAMAVAKVLKDGGLTAKKLVKTAMFGEDFNAVKTGDGVKTRGNRRVEITLKY